MMFAATLVTGGLFLDVADIPFWQKIVKLLTYLIVIFITVIFDIGKNYEKGAFGVPNELDEINGIWKEFELWEVPKWVIDEVENQNYKELKEENKTNDLGTTSNVMVNQINSTEEIENCDNIENKKEETERGKEELSEDTAYTRAVIQEKQN